jgi:hypothetical protein
MQIATQLGQMKRKTAGRFRISQDCLGVQITLEWGGAPILSYPPGTKTGSWDANCSKPHLVAFLRSLPSV